MRKIISITLLVFITSMIGCRDKSRPGDLPALYPCTITITQEGKLLEGAAVTFEPIDSSSVKYRATAITGVDGSATMNTYGFSGVPIGKYKVVIAKIIQDDIEYKLNESTGKNEPVSYKRYRTVEPQFSSAETTPHEIEITGKEKKAEHIFDVGKAMKTLIP
ncbi:MAG: carboxypeptidase-like regulatory domain-containing protein [Planctomycetaceae bacterium]|jgi:hypothetical protein|nr:carboxypeptidase-like regulatory domain-containing protein [Planctomycetaceae bacterium]